MTLPALTIAELYRCRWQVELFFKWIKQRIVFQMDQAASSDKGFLWNIRKRGEDSNLDCNICVCVGSHN